MLVVFQLKEVFLFVQFFNNIVGSFEIPTLEEEGQLKVNSPLQAGANLNSNLLKPSRK